MRRRKWSEVENILLELITSKGIMDYAEVAVELDVALPTASLYCRRLAQKYPENLEYDDGMLYLKKPFFLEEVDVDTQLKTLKQNLIAKERLQREVIEKLEKIASNHLPHREYEKTLNEIKRLIKKLKRL